MIFILASIGFFLWSIRTILFWTSLWQVKEYRLDRLFVHIKETVQGRRLLLFSFFWINIVLLLLYGVVIFNDTLTDTYHFLVLGFLAIEGLLFAKELVTGTFKRPALTIKSGLIFSLTLLAVIILYILVLLDSFAWLLVVQLSVPILVAVFVFAFSFPTEIYRDFIIQKARKKILAHPNLLVIGVSGSVGKTSTKEYLAHILSEKFTVLKTPLSNNTPIAIARTILSHLHDTTEIFIVEMGSYKRGEVKELCDIVQPKISITTTLGDQHISLYGSMNNIIATEKELITALPRDGVALFNANSPFMDRLYKFTRKEKILYATEKIKRKRSIDVLASNIRVERNGIDFQVKIGKKSFSLHAPLLGEHNVENILPAIYLADYLGMKQKEIVKAVHTLVPLPKTMKKFTTQQGVTLVDDTFNASPESVLAAASYLHVYNRKKIFVLMPLIELGGKAKEHHHAIGQALAQCNYLFLTNKNFAKEIQKGIADKKGKCKVITDRLDAIAQQISEITTSGDIVIFEGKEAGSVLTKLL